MAEAIRPNRTKSASPAAVAAYAVPDRMPEPIAASVRKALRQVADALGRAAPRDVACVVAYTPVSWEKHPSEVQLLTFARREGDSWEAFDTMADVLAPMMGELLFTPIIEPISQGEWESAAELGEEAPGWRHVAQRGILLYWTEGKNGQPA